MFGNTKMGFFVILCMLVFLSKAMDKLPVEKADITSPSILWLMKLEWLMKLLSSRESLKGQDELILHDCFRFLFRWKEVHLANHLGLIRSYDTSAGNEQPQHLDLGTKDEENLIEVTTIPILPGQEGNVAMRSHGAFLVFDSRLLSVGNTIVINPLGNAEVLLSIARNGKNNELMAENYDMESSDRNNGSPYDDPRFHTYIVSAYDQAGLRLKVTSAGWEVTGFENLRQYKEGKFQYPIGEERRLELNQSTIHLSVIAYYGGQRDAVTGRDKLEVRREN